MNSQCLREVLAAFCLLWAFSSLAVGEGANPLAWRKQISAFPSRPFPEISSFEAKFVFGWSDVVQAGEAVARFDSDPAAGTYQVELKGRSTGMARLLWRLDVEARANGQWKNLRPQRLTQKETYRNKVLRTTLEFDSNGVRRLRERTPDRGVKAKWKRYNDPEVRDLVAGMLFIRAQPLRFGETVGAVIDAGDNPFFVKVRATGRETVKAAGKDWDALRLELSIQKISTQKETRGHLEPFTKFRKGTVWISDDDRRIPLRVEVDIFVGFVYGQLESIIFASE